MGPDRGRQQRGGQFHRGVGKAGWAFKYTGAAARSQRGFSLIEIMVVVVIMGVLAALIVPNVMDRPDQARVIAARQDVASIMQALKLYRLDHGRYPTAEQGLAVLAARQDDRTAYMDRLPVDPWGAPYQYLNPGVHGEVDVFSLGADSAPGGEGNDAEVGSWGR
ncbi:type II secretion system major pseudopilin GspG [Castellaniella hirudinis]|uniref:type II secretion system major pseudopilin GspG n=1 Tax=Castellaniella hirudinis TaxID=1144617 RepID=UPI0039C08E22